MFEKNKTINIKVDGQVVGLKNDDLVLKLESLPGFLTAQTSGVVISLNTQMSKELLNEGFSREFINRVQNMRKDCGFSVVSKVKILLCGDQDAVDVVLGHKEHIQSEVLATSITQIKTKPKKNTLFEFNNYKLYIAIDND